VASNLLHSRSLTRYEAGILALKCCLQYSTSVSLWHELFVNSCPFFMVSVKEVMNRVTTNNTHTHKRCTLWRTRSEFFYKFCPVLCSWSVFSLTQCWSSLLQFECNNTILYKLTVASEQYWITDNSTVISLTQITKCDLN